MLPALVPDMTYTDRMANTNRRMPKLLPQGALVRGQQRRRVQAPRRFTRGHGGKGKNPVPPGPRRNRAGSRQVPGAAVTAQSRHPKALDKRQNQRKSNREAKRRYQDYWINHLRSDQEASARCWLSPPGSRPILAHSRFHPRSARS